MLAYKSCNLILRLYPASSNCGVDLCIEEGNLFYQKYFICTKPVLWSLLLLLLLFLKESFLKNEIRILYFVIMLGPLCTDHYDYGTSVQNHVYGALPSVFFHLRKARFRKLVLLLSSCNSMKHPVGIIRWSCYGNIKHKD